MGLIAFPLTIALGAIYGALEIAAWLVEAIGDGLGRFIEYRYACRVAACLRRAGATVKACRYA